MAEKNKQNYSKFPNICIFLLFRANFSFAQTNRKCTEMNACEYHQKQIEIMYIFFLNLGEPLC